MYNHLTTCEPPRPSLGKRIDLSDYQDPSQPLVSSEVVAPVSVIQPSPVSASSSMTVTEPALSYSPVATTSFPLHSPSLLETGVPMGEQASWGWLLGRPRLLGRNESGLSRGTGPADTPGLRFKQESLDPQKNLSACSWGCCSLGATSVMKPLREGVGAQGCSSGTTQHPADKS